MADSFSALLFGARRQPDEQIIFESASVNQPGQLGGAVFKLC